MKAIVSGIFLVSVFCSYAQIESKSKHHQYNEYLIEAKNEIADTREERSITKAHLDSLNKKIAENDSIMVIQDKSIDSLTDVINAKKAEHFQASNDLEKSKSLLSSTTEKNETNDKKVDENKESISQYNTILKELTLEYGQNSDLLNKTKLTLAQEQAKLARISSDYNTRSTELQNSQASFEKKETNLTDVNGKLVKVKVNIGETNARIEEKKLLISSKEKDIELYEDDIKKNNAEIADLRKAIGGYSLESAQARDQLTPLKDQLAQAEGVSVETINKKEADSLRIRDLGYQNHELEAKIELLENHIKNSEAKVEILETEIEHLRSKNEILDKERKEIELRKTKNTENIVSFSKELADLKKREGTTDADIKSETNFISTLDPNTPNRDSVINVKYEVIKKLQDRLYKIRLEKEKVNGQIDFNKNEISKIQQALAMKESDISANDNFISAKSTEIQNLKANIETQQVEKETYAKTVADGKLTIEQLTKNVNELNVLISSKNGKINNLKAQIPPLEDKILEMDNKRDVAEKRIEELQKSNKNHQIEISHNSTDVLTAKEEINSMRELNSTFDREKLTLENRILEVTNEKKMLTMEIDRLQTETSTLGKQKDVFETKVNGLQADEQKYTIRTDSLDREITAVKENIKRLSDENQGRMADGIEYRSTIDSLNSTIKVQEAEVSVMFNLIENMREDKKSRKKVKRGNYEHGLEMSEEAVLTNQKYMMLVSNIEDEILNAIDTALSGNHEGALQKLEALLLKEPEHKTLLVLAAFTRYVMRNYDGAMDFLNRTIKANPKYETAYMVRAETNIKQKNYVGAIKDYSQVIYLNKDNAEAYMKRGDLQKEYMNEWDKGCDDWYAAVKLGFMEANKQVVEYCNVPKKDRTYKIYQLSKESFDPEYGYSTKKPIKVGRGEEGKYANVEAYLRLLRDQKGKEVEFVRSSSCCAYNSENGINGKALVEQYLVTYKDEKGKKQQVTLNFSYFDFDQPLLIQGFKTNHEIY